MSGQVLRKRASRSASLKRDSGARSVLLEMARDEARAARIRSVIEQRKADDPAFTTRHIADIVQVSERAVADWKRWGAISKDNCGKLAELVGVSPTWLWLGRENQTPDLLDTLEGAGPSHQVELGFDEFRGYVREILAKLAEAGEERAAMKQLVAQQNENMAKQTELLALLPAIQRVLDALPAAEAAAPPAAPPARGSAKAPAAARQDARRSGQARGRNR